MNLTYFDQHPFVIVLITAFIFMGLLLKEDMRVTKHYRRRKDIEKRKLLKNENNR